jgi:hypothetical protein
LQHDVFQKQYDFELEQRNGIASATNTPIVALTILGGALASIITGFKYSQSWLTYLFLAFVILTCISMLICIYKIVRTFLGYSYQKIPNANLLKQHLKELKVWHSTNNGTETAAQNDFNEYFDERLSEAAEHNSQNNIKRGNYLHDATVSVVIAFIFLFIASPFYIYQKVSANENIYQVKLIKEEVKMSENESGNSNQTQQASPAAAPAQTPTAAPKPSGPQNVIFKGNTDQGSVKATDNMKSKNS